MANRYKRQGGPKNPRRRLWAGLLKAAVAAMVVCAALYSVAWAAGRAWHRTASLEVFSVRGVGMSGIKHVRQSDLIEFMGGVEGEGIFDVDMDALLKRLGSHPWIKSAAVKRELPDGLRLTITERVPAASAVAGERRCLVDTEGFVLAEVEGESWGYLPVIVCDPASQPGQAGSGPHAGLVMALALYGAVRSEPTERLAGGVVHLAGDGVPCLVIDGAVVEVGTDGYSDKVRRLAEIFDDMHRRGISPGRIDLRFPGKVIVDGSRSRQS